MCQFSTSSTITLIARVLFYSHVCYNYSDMSQESSEQNPTSNAALNKLRAAVLGANDGIVSTAAVVAGVAGATASDTKAIFTAGMAALVAGAFSMAVGEYVSVSSQRDAEEAYIAKEKAKLAAHPEEEQAELARMYHDLGISEATAAKVAEELSAIDPLKAHLQVEFQIDEDDLNSPIQAALASFLAFTAGGLVPFLAVILAPAEARIPVVLIAVAAALVCTGYFSARAGNASRLRAVLRVVIGGILAMVATYGIGHLFGTTIG